MNYTTTLKCKRNLYNIDIEEISLLLNFNGKCNKELIENELNILRDKYINNYMDIEPTNENIIKELKRRINKDNLIDIKKIKPEFGNKIHIEIRDKISN